MACRMIYAERFLDDAAQVWSGRLQMKLVNALANIEAFPEIGSRNFPQSIKEEFGDAVRKVALDPFDLVYEYDKATQTVFVYALVPMRTAH